MIPHNERVIAYLENEDPDVVVDLLDITTEELLEAFPQKVLAYLRDELEDED